MVTQIGCSYVRRRRNMNLWWRAVWNLNATIEGEGFYLLYFLYIQTTWGSVDDQIITKEGELLRKLQTHKKKMVSYFCGWHKLVNDFIYKLVLLNLLICSCLSLSRSVSMASAADIDDQVLVNNNNPLNQLMSSQEDMVQIAGYGEEKLSTVLITGSVHCEEACNNLHAQTHHPDYQLHLHAWPLSGLCLSTWI